MNHFQRILESAELAEAEYGNKSLGSFADYADADFPGELRPSGKPDPEEKKRAERAYKSLRGRYRSDLSKVISSYLSKEKKYREAINAGLDVMDKAFVDAFIFGMRAQAAKKGVSAKFDLADQHYRWILSASEEEGRYFEDFLKDLRYKRDLRPGSMDWEQRVELYAKTLDSVFDAGRVAALALADNIVIYWVVNPEAESCNGCLLLEEKSPFTPDNLPCTPRDGATECLCILSPDSRVLTSTGWVAISDVRVGDSVVTHTGRLSKVTATPTSILHDPEVVRFRAPTGAEIICTRDHLWLSEDGWTSIDKSELMVYTPSHAKDSDLSKLWDADGPESAGVYTPEVLFMGVLQGQKTRYDLTVEGEHSFILEGVASHNSNCRCNLLVKKVSAEEYAKVEFDQLPKDALLYQVNLFKQMKLGTNRTRKRR